MATITLESDSSHSPLGLHQSNERSSQKSPKIQQIGESLAADCENSHMAA